MSVQAIAWALQQKTSSPSAKVVLLALANYADEAGTCWPGQERLARETDQSVDSVQRRLRELEKLGLLSREARSTIRGRSSDRYRLHLANPMGVSGSGLSKTADCGFAAKPQTVRRKAATVRLCNKAEPSAKEPSPTPLPPQGGGEGSVCQPGDTQSSRWLDLVDIWSFEPGEPRQLAEMEFKRLCEADQRQALAAAGEYVAGCARAGRKRAYLINFLAKRMFVDFGSHGKASSPAESLVFVAVGTDEFEAWNKAYREAGRPGMLSSSIYDGRNGWWCETAFPRPGWRPRSRTVQPRSSQN